MNISFGYDQQFFGTLSNITGANYTFKYRYDDRFRVIKEEAAIDGITFETGMTFDSMDRVISLLPGAHLRTWVNRKISPSGNDCLRKER